jgi:Uma2 family endonuclease
MKQRSQTANGLVTVSEFYRRVPDGQKADLLDGVIYMASPDTLESNDLTGFVDFLLRGFNSAKKLGGKVFVSRFAFRLTRYRAPEPDVAFVTKRRLRLLSRREMKGGPDVAVEIVSADSRRRDYGEKKRIYQAAGVSEYWIIDPLKKRVEFHRLRDGKYQLVPLEDGRIFRSKVVPGFWLDVNWLLSDPLPDPLECLEEILS